MAPRLTLSSERGFTIIELTVAMIVLAVGILGTVAMVDTSNAGTSKTKAREGATNLGRAVMEVARAVPYKDLGSDTVVAELQNHTGLEDADHNTGNGYQIRSRNFTYSVTVNVCTIDDPKDRLGDQNEALAFCSDSQTASAGATGKDRNPDDYRRVTIQMSWKAPDSVLASTKQTGVITNPVGGLGPSVTALTPTYPSASTTVTTVSGAPAPKVSFAAKTSSTPAYVNWSANGDEKGKAATSGVDSSFDWDLTPTRADGSPVYYDCTWVVEAKAFDDKDRSGASKAVTITLNRRTPLAPGGFRGGRNLNGTRVDLQWAKNQECDVTGYKVYRGTSATAPLTDLVCTTTSASATDCIDSSAPAPAAGQTLYYEVVALDTDSTAARTPREGTRSARLAIVEGDTAPTAPAGLSACVGGSAGCNDINGDPVPAGNSALTWSPSSDPDTADSVYFYRVYRLANANTTPTYANRYDILFSDPSKPLVFVDGKPLPGQNTYYVTAVDHFFGESAPVGPVTVSP